MSTKARELARHFETQGTPVMTGVLCLPESAVCCPCWILWGWEPSCLQWMVYMLTSVCLHNPISFQPLVVIAPHLLSQTATCLLVKIHWLLFSICIIWALKSWLISSPSLLLFEFHLVCSFLLSALLILLLTCSFTPGWNIPLLQILPTIDYWYRAGCLCRLLDWTRLIMQNQYPAKAGEVNRHIAWYTSPCPWSRNVGLCLTGAS